MPRRLMSVGAFLWKMVAAGFSLRSVLLLLASTALPANPPNFLLIMVDDAGAESFESYSSNPINLLDGQSIETPRISALAEEGVRFTHAFATPLCTPTRLQLTTGQYNFRNYRTFWYIDNAETTFAQILQANGYRTAVAGKWQSAEPGDHPSRHDAGYGQDQGVAPTGPTASNRSFHMAPQVMRDDYGFDEYFVHALNHTFLQYSSRRYWNPVVETISADGLRTVEPPTNSNDYGPDLFTDFLKEFISANAAAGVPFLAYYPMTLPHDPWVSTPDSETTFKNGSNEIYYDDMVEYADTLVGRLVDHLNDPNGDGDTSDSIAENTVVIFTSDNGTDGGVHRTHEGVTIQTDDGVVRGGKTLPTYYGTHVPFIVRWPGTLAPGESDRMIDFTDVFPTLLELAGVEAPIDLRLDGQPIISQDGEVLRNRDVAYGYYRPLWGSQVPQTVTEYAQEQRYKLYGDGRMIDLAEDPGELVTLNPESLTEEQKAIRTRLQETLDYYDAQQEIVPRMLNGFTRQISDENLDGVGDRRANTVLIVGDNVTNDQEYRVIAEFDLGDPNAAHLRGRIGGATLVFDVTAAQGNVPDIRLVALNSDEQTGSNANAADDFHTAGTEVAVFRGLAEGDRVEVDLTEYVRADGTQRFTSYRLEGVGINPSETPGPDQIRLGGLRGEGVGLETSLRLLISARGDFNEDGQISARDIDLMDAALASSEPSMRHDLNGDSLVDGTDRDLLITSILKTSPGDVNLDGVVDLDDFETLLDNFGRQRGWARGDFNGDGIVDEADLSVLRQSFEPVFPDDSQASVTEADELIGYAFLVVEDGDVVRRLPRFEEAGDVAYMVRVPTSGEGDLRSGYVANGITYAVEYAEAVEMLEWQHTLQRFLVDDENISHPDGTATYTLRYNLEAGAPDTLFLRTSISP